MMTMKLKTLIPHIRDISARLLRRLSRHAVASVAAPPTRLRLSLGQPCLKLGLPVDAGPIDRPPKRARRLLEDDKVSDAEFRVGYRTPGVGESSWLHFGVRVHRIPTRGKKKQIEGHPN